VSTVVDTDFTAKLVDVHPSGEAVNLCDGIVRARFRDSLERTSPIEPGRAYRYEISLGPLVNVFGRGHRIRLEVSSSNFPIFDRNSNSGKPVATAGPSDWAQTVLHDSDHPSSLELPVIP